MEEVLRDDGEDGLDMIQKGDRLRVKMRGQPGHIPSESNPTRLEPQVRRRLLLGSEGGSGVCVS